MLLWSTLYIIAGWLIWEAILCFNPKSILHPKRSTSRFWVSVLFVVLWLPLFLILAYQKARRGGT